MVALPLCYLSLLFYSLCYLTQTSYICINIFFLYIFAFFIWYCAVLIFFLHMNETNRLSRRLTSNIYIISNLNGFESTTRLFFQCYFVFFFLYVSNICAHRVVAAAALRARLHYRSMTLCDFKLSCRGLRQWLLCRRSRNP